jgi:hypothetical protein
MFGLSIYAVVKGRTKILVAPFDHAGANCGISAGYENYSKLYLTKTNFADITSKKTLNEVLGSGVCVTSCPKKADIANVATWAKTNCMDGTQGGGWCSLNSGSSDKSYTTIEFGTLCIPDPTDPDNS